MYNATIQHVEKTDDEIKIVIGFSNDEKSFEKTYSFVHMVDINTRFEETVIMELNRINDLEDGYTVLKKREGDKIKLK